MLECLRFAFSVTEHLFAWMQELCTRLLKKRVTANQNHSVVSGSGAAWLLHQHCEVSVVIKGPNSLVRAR